MRMHTEYLLFEVKNGIVTALGDTEENLNDGAYPMRVEAFIGGGWELELSPNSRVEEIPALVMEMRGLVCGGICFYHEEADEFINEMDCLMSLSSEQKVVLLFGEEAVGSLPDGAYIVAG